jgi:hypothetical protein
METAPGIHKRLFFDTCTALQATGLACGLASCHAEPPLVASSAPWGLQQPTDGLVFCSGCFRIAYCNPTCQRAGWKDHRPMCRAFKEANEVEASMGRALTARKLSPFDALAVVVASVEKIDEARTKGAFVDKALLMLTRRCRNCLRTPHTLPTLAVEMGGRPHSTLRAYYFCRACKIAACCSEECWREYMPVRARARARPANPCGRAVNVGH